MEEEINNIREAFRIEAIKNTVNAFNEGFLLGEKYAKQLFEEDKK